MYFIESKSLVDITDEFKKRLIRLAKTDDSIRGISSGFKKLDVITRGFLPSSLTIVGGVRGMGKTSFAVSLVKKMAIENRQATAFFSLKWTSEQFIRTILCQQTNIDSTKLRLGLLNENEKKLVHTQMEQIKTAPLEFFDHPFLTVADIEEVLLCRPPDCLPEIVVIDSLQLLAKNKKDKVGKILNKKELTDLTFQLKELAKKHQIAIVLTTTIQAQSIKKGDQRSNLSNVKNYAPIANYADLILLLYRPEYYKIDEWDDDDETPANGEGEIIIAKNANGILDSIRVKFNGAKSEFDDLQ